MATLTINTRNAFATMDNGATVPVPNGWTNMTLQADTVPELIRYPNGEELWFTHWTGEVAGFNVDDLADGQTWKVEGVSLTRRGNSYSTSIDGSEWMRYGNEMVVRTPKQVAKAA